MITKERAEKAKAKLINNADKIEDFCRRLSRMAEPEGILDKWNGKLVNKRIYIQLAHAYGLEEKTLTNGETWFENARFILDYQPPPRFGKKVPQMKVRVCDGWGDFGIPLYTGANERLDAAQTREAWGEIVALNMTHAKEQRDSAALINKSVKFYNKVEAEVKKFMEESLGGGTRSSIAITTLCAFGGDIYDRLNAFRWLENKAEVE